jgi:cysteinyl-tRNA synthetase
VLDTLTRKKATFTSSSGTVKFFVCGPTVYDFIHLGHARTYIAFDIITRYLKYAGYHVRYLMNITDVADRLIERAAKSKKDPLELAREYEQAFLEDIKALGITNIERCERASDYIPQIIAQIRTLMEKGVAYRTETGVYFEVNKFPKFGQLSGLSKDELGLRRLELCSSKLNPEDFSLWRRHDTGLLWDSPWGKGRPGWHIEDTAISMQNFGETYDLHGGASELIFPHHEAEIAQAESMTGRIPFVRFWLHTGLLSLRGRKMSKSLGNVIRVRDALKEYTAQDLRYYFASFHYRQQIDVSDTALKQASSRLRQMQKNLDRFRDAQTIHSAVKGGKLQLLAKRTEEEFRKHMDNDFDTPRALASLNHLGEVLAGQSNSGLDIGSKETIMRAFLRMAEVFGILSPI